LQRPGQPAQLQRPPGAPAAPGVARPGAPNKPAALRPAPPKKPPPKEKKR
jgi:hypothetical protein